MEKEFSLLWPMDYIRFPDKIKRLSSTTVKNLNLSDLCLHISDNIAHAKYAEEILSSICCDVDVLSFRQEIFNDLVQTPLLLDNLLEVTMQIESLSLLDIDSSMKQESSFLQYFVRLKELNAYINCYTEIYKALEHVSVSSRGLTQLKDRVKQIVENSDFVTLKEALNKLTLEISEIKSINIGLNLDADLNPVEAAVVSINNTEFEDHSKLRRALNSMMMNPDEWGILSKLHPLVPDQKQPTMHHQYKDIESIFRPVVRDMHSDIKRYAVFSSRFMINLIPELTFYMNVARWSRHLMNQGMPLCRPEIALIEDRKCYIHDAYNPCLASYMMKENKQPAADMVLNDVSFDDTGRIMILTGPNRGGKTVYTEMIGLEQVLFHAGAYVAGTYACISPADCIYTHFPADENQTTELGRLGEEAKRLNEILVLASSNSIILLNESFTSTSLTESLYIAKDVIKSLKYMGVRAVYNTHMHDLAHYADDVNLRTAGDSLVVSFVTDFVDGERAFKIRRGAPFDKSYAHDVAMQFRICYEQVVADFDQRTRNIH